MRSLNDFAAGVDAAVLDLEEAWDEIETGLAIRDSIWWTRFFVGLPLMVFALLRETSLALRPLSMPSRTRLGDLGRKEPAERLVGERATSNFEDVVADD